ncbi:MAG: Lrp/AsnC ligand binding domain-containing protein [Chloroflexi bacterium]|nr:Lrp/AsnC ligand binding domain-containing protein [Chloroflexota bacterium]
MIRAYILIEASVGKGNSILTGLRKVPGVVRADRVTGPYDVVCVLEVDDLDKLGNLVRDKIHTIDGIIRTMSCVSFSQ